MSFVSKGRAEAFETEAHFPKEEGPYVRSSVRAAHAAGSERFALPAEQIDALRHSVRSRMSMMDETEEDKVQRMLDKTPTGSQCITIKSLFVGACLSVVFCIILCKLNLSPAGIIPSMTIPGGMISYISLKGLHHLEDRMVGTPLGRLLRINTASTFTVQETNVAQTFITTATNVVWTAGVGSYLTGLAANAKKRLEEPDPPVPDPNDTPTYEPVLSTTIPFMLCVAIIGIFCLVWVRKYLIVDHNLTYPSGTAMGVMLNSFFSKDGDSKVKQQLSSLALWGCFSFFFAFFKWTFSSMQCDFCADKDGNSVGVGCGGFSSMPTFGVEAYNWTWYFDWTLYLVGAGMLISMNVSGSQVLGAILSWGIMWPAIAKKEGDWYEAGLGSHDFRGLFGYKVMLSISIFVGDGSYQVVKAFMMGMSHFRRVMKHKREAAAKMEEPPVPGSATERVADDLANAFYNCTTVVSAPCTACAGAGPVTRLKEAYDVWHAEGHDEHMFNPLVESSVEKKYRLSVFLSQNIPGWVSIAGYLSFMVLGTIVIPHLYPNISWVQCLVAYLMAPFLALPNCYAVGLTDQDNSSMFGKMGIFLFATWSGIDGYGVVTGLVACGILLAATSQAATLMQDFRTAYITGTPPLPMFLVQLGAAFFGVVIAPSTFMIFYNTGLVGVENSEYSAPWGVIYRSMAIFGVEGFSALPKYCAELMIVFFFVTILLDIIQDVLPSKYAVWVPNGLSMGIPFYLGAFTAIDMGVGTVIAAVWSAVNPETATLLLPAVASGLIVGEGLWGIPSAIMATAGVEAPMCMNMMQGPRYPVPDT